MSDVIAQMDRSQWKRWLLFLILFGILMLSLSWDVATGPAMLTVPEVLRTLLAIDRNGMNEVIIFSIRLPVALMALVVGAALGLSGCTMQTVLNNPLASSCTLGISASAGFGAALVIVFGIGESFASDYMLPLFAFLFAMLACGVVFLIGHFKGGRSDVFVLAGVALLFMFQSMLSFLQYIASQEALQQIVFWLFGSLYKANLQRVGLVAGVLLLGFPLLLKDSWQLTALSLGEERARSLGIHVGRLRLRSMAYVSALTGVAVAFVGTIGFIGLIAPHIARFLFGEDQRLLLPGSALTGALLLSLASVVSKVLSSGAIMPIGIVTAMIGVPFFLLLVLKSKAGFW